MWHRAMIDDVPPTTRPFDSSLCFVCFRRAVGAVRRGSPTCRAKSGGGAAAPRWLDGSGALALSQTGNRLRHWLDLNGDADFTDADELERTGTSGLAKELGARDTDADGEPPTPPWEWPVPDPGYPGYPGRPPHGGCYAWGRCSH